MSGLEAPASRLLAEEPLPPAVSGSGVAAWKVMFSSPVESANRCFTSMLRVMK